MELGSSDDRVYAAERILKKRIKKVRDKRDFEYFQTFLLLLFRLGFFSFNFNFIKFSKLLNGKFLTLLTSGKS